MAGMREADLKTKFDGSAHVCTLMFSNPTLSSIMDGKRLMRRRSSSNTTFAAFFHSSAPDNTDELKKIVCHVRNVIESFVEQNKEWLEKDLKGHRRRDP
jgi:hypothetical protein